VTVTHGLPKKKRVAGTILKENTKQNRGRYVRFCVHAASAHQHETGMICPPGAAVDLPCMQVTHVLSCLSPLALAHGQSAAAQVHFPAQRHSGKQIKVPSSTRLVSPPKTRQGIMRPASACKLPRGSVSIMHVAICAAALHGAACLRETTADG
jgi:hypothetical protein